MTKFVQLPVRFGEDSITQIRSYNLNFINEFNSASQDWIDRGYGSVMFINDLDESERLVRVALSYDELHAYLNRMASK